jgi:hypothetical protein
MDAIWQPMAFVYIGSDPFLGSWLSDTDLREDVFTNHNSDLS